MANDLTKSGTLPGIIEDDGAEIVDGFVALINTERGRDALPKLPTRDERAAMEQRAAKLNTTLRPVSLSTTQQDDAMQLIGQLFARYPSMRNHDIRVMASAYLDDLERLPLFAIRATIDDVRFGRIAGLDPDYPPTSPRLFKAGEAHLVRPATELNKTKRVLAITEVVVPPSAKVIKKVEQLFVEFAEASKQRLAEEESERRQAFGKKYTGPYGRDLIRREYDALGVETPTTGGSNPLPISASLARQLGGLPRKKRREV